jgi:hypothetical protein
MVRVLALLMILTRGKNDALFTAPFEADPVTATATTALHQRQVIRSRPELFGRLP